MLITITMHWRVQRDKNISYYKNSANTNINKNKHFNTLSVTSVNRNLNKHEEYNPIIYDLGFNPFYDNKNAKKKTVFDTEKLNYLLKLSKDNFSRKNIVKQSSTKRDKRATFTRNNRLGILTLCRLQ